MINNQEKSITKERDMEEIKERGPGTDNTYQNVFLRNGIAARNTK